MQSSQRVKLSISDAFDQWKDLVYLSNEMCADWPEYQFIECKHEDDIGILSCTFEEAHEVEPVFS